MGKLYISKIPNLNTIVIRQSEVNTAFISTNDSIIISIPSLTYILKFLVKNGYMSIKALEGIISELKE